MGSLTKQILINAPAQTIWDILAAVERTPEWIDGVQESERTGEVCEGVGLRWRELSVLERQHIEMAHEMVAWEPLKHLKVRSVLPMNGWLERTLEIKSSGSSQEVEIKVDWDLGIAGMLLGEKKVADLMETLFETTLANLKDLAEKDLQA
ncbi:MAG: SRPBCC family protein [Candidatus Omnitrophica bacterium]|nr:SRPBCC family protein [Candidatus Omnitrophota bacterium]